MFTEWVWSRQVERGGIVNLMSRSRYSPHSCIIIYTHVHTSMYTRTTIRHTRDTYSVLCVGVSQCVYNTL